MSAQRAKHDNLASGILQPKTVACKIVSHKLIASKRSGAVRRNVLARTHWFKIVCGQIHPPILSTEQTQDDRVDMPSGVELNSGSNAVDAFSDAILLSSSK